MGIRETRMRIRNRKPMRRRRRTIPLRQVSGHGAYNDGALCSSWSSLEHWMYTQELDTASHHHELYSSLSSPHFEQGMYSRELDKALASHPHELCSSPSIPHLQQQRMYIWELDTASHHHELCRSQSSPHFEHWMYSRELHTVSHPHELCRSHSSPHQQHRKNSQELDKALASHHHELYSSPSSPH